ncbi:hypothetical protein [uncultured Tenacibaculum sp.]|uniref:hypothetical protein n=1 Tax=uncultured Tenacibaculum sp. TaxID=174713 RepID=UPI002630B9CE|nr:hypothetical protein [uncultured Tenacibaculum sp.]
MKNLLKFVAVVAILSFVSCTDNQEIVTENGQVIQTDEFAVGKGDSSNPNNDGGIEQDYDEE